MRIALYPRAAPPDRLRVWVGIFQAATAPTLNWFLDGNPVAPVALRQIASVRADDMLPQGVSPDSVSRAFTGVYEFNGLTPETLHRVGVQGDEFSEEIEVSTMPDTVPAAIDRSFNVLLVSCFHQAEDRSGLAGTIVSQLKATSRPHLTLLMGDQVYLDLPTLQNFKDNLAWLAEKFESDYTHNWQEPPGYAEVLRAAPSVSIPDDHEYWNNFPHPSPIVGNTLFNPAGRDRWRRAAQAMYEGFQLPYPAGLGEAFILDVPPLSFFLADTRTFKNIDRQFTMSDQAHAQLDAWISQVIAKGHFGVFASGQSLFRDPAGAFSGGVGDFELSNYGDYGRLMTSLSRLADAGRPLICLTGDVHWGRVTEAIDRDSQRRAFVEIISSPSSLVTTIGQDQFKKVGNFFGGLFGKSAPWPRHSDAGKPPVFLASGVLEGRFSCSAVHNQRGNHVSLLRFRRHGSGIELNVEYWPISQDAEIGRRVELPPINLVSA